MPTHQLEHDRPNCIGCAACVAIAPDFWKMDDEEGKSDIIDGTRKEDGTEERDLEEQDVPLNREAAEACPVNVIHLRDLKTGKRII